MDTTTPFHVGETRVQTRMGVREAIEPFARRVVRDHMPDQHRDFFHQLPFVVVAARDSGGRPWATLLAAPDGLVASPDRYTLDISATPVAGDALERAFVTDADIGILGIEFHTRRRNRVNGRIADASGAGFRFRVEQSFGNCPQFIHGRDWQVADPRIGASREVGDRLNARQQAWIARADTFFIASGFRGAGDSPSYGMDASHRGGPAGFVRVVDEKTLVWPDYAGNNHYNTLGNLVMDSRIGLVFVDFTSGSLLQLTGEADIEWAPDQAQWPGAERLVKMNIAAVVALHDSLPLRWHTPTQLALEVDEVIEESAEVRSFWLRQVDGQTLPPFRAGQHLPVTVPLDGSEESRSYSISSSPRDPRWRLSVKRVAGGLVSSHLHEAWSAGARFGAGLPSGDFVLEQDAHSVVLIGAGIGITPLLSMLAEAVARGTETLLLYAARNASQAALLGEIEAYARQPGVRVHRAFSQPEARDEQGKHLDTAGRLSQPLLVSCLPQGDFHAYVCGPVAFVEEVSDWLSGAGVAPNRIHCESFG